MRLSKIITKRCSLAYQYTISKQKHAEELDTVASMTNKLKFLGMEGNENVKKNKSLAIAFLTGLTSLVFPYRYRTK